MILNVQYINKVSFRDTNLALIANKFLERFASYRIILLIDLFSSYNYITLHLDS
jgi:hypothetical protein